jgi:MFS family permease
VLWNVATAVSYFCNSFIQIIFPRMAFAILSAACNPASLSLINSYFSNRGSSLGKANSFFSFGIYCGIGFSSLTLIMDKAFGWRVSILIVCGVSLAFALLLFFIPDPPHHKATTEVS